MVRPDTFFELWKAAREDGAQAVEEMPAGQLDFRPQEDMMSFRSIATHIVDVGRGLTGLLLDGATDFTQPGFRERLAHYLKPLPEDADGQAIAAEMRTAIEEDCARLARQTAEFFGGMVTKWDGLRLTRLEMLQFVKEHELAHRMQLFVYLRMNGVTPPTTRRKLARK